MIKPSFILNFLQSSGWSRKYIVLRSLFTIVYERSIFAFTDE
uniref:Uncharacterized protein n=1 Tax=Klebsiella pneumoniae TaxID=573 RepID=A0A6M5ZZA5_KLEPN|nr:hypothetical protein [Klebsiella pneumoniae]QJX12167.1 hypothetical protein [Klebsiella pneumoniae]